MSTTERKLFSYDLEEDADIHEFFNQLPKRQHSKYIRIALRLLKEQLETGNLTTSREALIDKTNKANHKQMNTKHDEENNFEDLSDDILNMGK